MQYLEKTQKLKTVLHKLKKCFINCQNLKVLAMFSFWFVPELMQAAAAAEDVTASEGMHTG